MSEREPVFDSPRDTLLYALAINGWACETSGGDSVLGYTAWMSNSDCELPELLDTEAVEEAGVELDDPRRLIGHWLIDQSGVYVEVTSFASEDEVRAAYSRIEELYTQVPE
jgi:hypothetical protein